MAISQTQPLGYSFDPDDDDIRVWGRLIPTSSSSKKYTIFELTAEESRFGRDTIRCEFELNEPQISAVHTEIHRNLDETDSSCGKIYDRSTNGTYINRKKIGKNKHVLLFDGDEISFICAAKKDKKTGEERGKVSFFFYKNEEQKHGAGEHSIYGTYDLRSTLGSGSFATVKLGIHRETGDRYAVKEIDKKKYELKSKSRTKNSIMNEANILQQIDHANIIKVHDIFDEDNKLYIVLEMAFGGELFQRIIDHKRLSEAISRHIMMQLLSAIMYLHEKKIAHRDLKPENILMVDAKSWNIKITDFGLSKLLDCDQALLTTMCGTPLFLAPEVLSSKKRGGYGFEVDYWSCGVILYLMLVGHPPYNDKEGNLLDLVKSGKYSFPTQTWNTVSAQAKDLVLHLMQVDVNKRYNGEQVLAHEWMKMRDASADIASNNGNKKKRRICGDDEDTKQPPRKRYKTNTNNLMSMDSANHLTPFDSVIHKAEPQRKPNKANVLDDKKQNNVDINGNGSGNGASFVFKNSVVMKEMSLD